MIKTFLKATVAASALMLAACGNSEQSSQTADQSAVVATAAKPELGDWGVDLTARKDSIKPGDDFFRYANGTWLDTYEIPADRTRYGAFDILRERSDERVRGIIEELASMDAEKGTPEQKVGDFYASWMDTQTVDSLGIAPLQADIDRIAAISSVGDLTALLGASGYIDGESPIAIGLGINRMDPDRYVLNVGLGGLGLPDRDYYLDESERFQNIRAAYVANMVTMLGFAGVADAAAKADAIMALETKIAELQWPRAERRNRDKTFNPSSVSKLVAEHGGFDWVSFLSAAGIEGLDELNVSHPDVIEPLIGLVNNTPLDTWKAYLTYHLMANNAGLLSEEIDSANFEFWGKVLNGQPEQRARWKRGVQLTGDRESLGEALGQVYVKRYFPPEAKAQMVALVENLRKAYGERINGLAWMGEETKKEAQAKLAAFRPKIGYPDEWQDLSAIDIEKGDLFGNARRIRKFFTDFDNARLFRKTDKDEWFMTPQTVNAYYNPSFNEIVFPAAILQPPFFDPNADPAVNYGAIGAVIGHEMGHGFDDQGSKSDANGVQRNWWTDDDRAAFEARTGKLGAQYSGYEAVPGNFVDGSFTMGENIGDLGGITVAYHAYKLSLGGEEPAVVDGLTGTQRFLLGYAQVWKGKTREEALLARLKSDPHSPPEFRVNGVVRNLDIWYDAFGVKEGDALYLPPEERVSIW